MKICTLVNRYITILSMSITTCPFADAVIGFEMFQYTALEDVFPNLAGVIEVCLLLFDGVVDRTIEMMVTTVDETAIGWAIA